MTTAPRGTPPEDSSGRSRVEMRGESRESSTLTMIGTQINQPPPAIGPADYVAMATAARAPVSWPCRVGVVPARAEFFQHRGAADALDEVMADGGTAVLYQVLAGTGGVGKTQLAAAYARAAWEAGSVDLLAWVTADSRDAVVAAYAQAGAEVLGADPGNPQQASARFLIWLETTPRRWLVVLDDLAGPADLRELLPPASIRSRVLITTRRRDAALWGEGRRLVPVGMFTPDEAAAYLTANLHAHNRADRADQIRGLAADLGFLPMALAQAAAYLTDVGLDCKSYRERLADRRRRLPDLVPDRGGLPDDHRATLAATWSLSIEQADLLRPAGLSRPMLELASVLDPNGIPKKVLTSPPALTYLTQHRTSSADTGSDATDVSGGNPDACGQVDADDAADALHCLYRLSLAELDLDAPHRAVRVHNLIQRASRESLPGGRDGPLARAAADALEAAWPEIGRNTAMAQALRSSTSILAGHAQDRLWQPDGHRVLFRAGDSFGDAGLVKAAITYWQDQHSSALRYLGPDHPHTLAIRGRLASRQGEAGDMADAAAALKELLADDLRVLGPNDPETLRTRASLARWTGEVGDPAGALDLFAELLPDDLRILGPDHPDTLRTRASLAGWTGQAGKPVEAREQFKALLPDDRQFLGPDHPETLNDLASLARWTGEAGNPAGARDQFAELLPIMGRVRGPDHPETLKALASVAGWTGEAGDPADARNQFGEMLAEVERVFGPTHPETLKVRASLARWTGEAGNPVAAREQFKALLPDDRQFRGPEHPDTLDDRANLGYWTGKAGDPAGARDLFAELLPITDRVLGPEHPVTLRARGYIARWTGEIGDPAWARDQFQALLPIVKRVLGTGHPDTGTACTYLAHWTGEAGDPVAARDQFRALLSIRERDLSSEHPDTLITRASVAGWTGEAGDPAWAREECAALLPVIGRVLGPEHPETLAARASLARWTGQAGNPAGARDQFQALLPIVKRVLATGHPDTLNDRANLGHWTGKAGDPAGARDLFAELLPITDRVLGPKHPVTLRARASLARWTGEAGDPAGARDLFAELLPVMEQVLGLGHRDTVRAAGWNRRVTDVK